MRPGSIRLRLLLAGGLSVVAALAVAGAGLAWLFERHVERRVEVELSTYLDQLIAGVGTDPAGDFAVVDPPADPRFSVPLSGLVWQVTDPGGRPIRSRSLWDKTLSLPAADAADGALHVHEIDGPDGELYLAVERRVRDAALGDKPFRVAGAITHRDIEQATRDFAFDLAPALAVLAVVLILAGWVQVTVGLLPLDRIRRAVADVVSGRASRLDAGVPVEVRPLADEINRLLDAQTAALARARSAAADLAHGLKTPLQLLGGDIRMLRARGETDIAAGIDAVTATIRRHVERELARARAAPRTGGPARSIVADVARRVIDVVRRTPQGEPLRFDIAIPPAMAAAVDETDLAEILGNLVENAARFAASAVRVEASEESGKTRLVVADDGPGIPAGRREEAVARGVRLDQRGDGAGLGLAIVSDLAEAYGGRLDLADAGPGLRATVTVPAPNSVDTF
ncbi:MAG TPA: HAMP domain-containing sensor histidine kinase [Bauldia sp.]|nr:HAMP domain-containing sensor histidine kinase [Bauldia sp.]